MESQLFVWSASASSNRKRKRQPILSCARCRLFRVKCDRDRPCGSCKLAGRESACKYQETLDHETAASSSVARKDTNHTNYVDGDGAKTPQIFAYVHGTARLSTYTTGWAQLFEEAKDYAFGIAPDFKPIYRKSQAHRDIFSMAAGDLSLSSSANVMLDKSELSALLPDRQVAKQLLETYLKTFETLFPMWEPRVDIAGEFDLLKQDNEHHAYSSYQQMFMMLALGCCSSQLSLPGVDQAESCQVFLDAAAIASKHIIWDVPDYPSLRAHCMGIIANLALHDTVSHLPTSPALVGLVVRAAMSMAMHRDSRHFEGMPESEAMMRNRLWTTIVWLDLFTSAVTGIPPLIRTDSHDVNPIGTYGETSPSNDGSSEFLTLLTKVLPTAELIITKSNSVNPEIDYAKVKDCDNLLKRSLDNSRNLPDLLHASMLDIFIRRTLLALHLPYSRHGRYLQKYPDSHWAVLECSLALLNCHQRFAAEEDMQWFINIFRDDMQLALIYVVLGIRRKDFSPPLDAIPQLENDPEEIAWHAIRQSVEIFNDQAHKSWSHYRVYLTSLWMVTALEALKSSTSLSMLAMMSEATENAINDITARFHESDIGE
ncbi:hypothetical protein PFICI_14665 [Pestalotiopsis fici W106-1]|uniref:Zn(2)-C6 fungal-type domain-containing protein n=1 Tax=Pestalotiopsis fici (strain W106-1 / CGMCC3.15140) TaxID=1229662 RepID=W3WIY8_PESFW|nr:uncharacterized protein PFICI_14665 [Pestalotiopsis fici W106-1]ETS73719.1 hypothetical protein PFICI_14665 [Pestalotiopsis fici W106-1]